MADFIWFLLVVLALAVASYQRTSLVTAVCIAGGVMILGTLFGDIGLLGWIVRNYQIEVRPAWVKPII